MTALTDDSENSEHTAVGSVQTLTKFLDPLQIPQVLRPAVGGEPAELTIRMGATWVRLHSQLPPTRVWAYNNSFPGPTIIVRRGQRLRVTWKNRLDGPIPLTAVETSQDVQKPGRLGSVPRADVAALPPWTVVHLHGAVTGGGNDGWTDNGVSPGHAQLSEYPNDQPAGTFWYHDHAMAITRWNVFAGLLGMYLIRDEEEDALNLPTGLHEMPLIICDRNIDTDDAGGLNGQLLYKVGIIPTTPPEKLTVPFTGPFTLVNGTIWPHLKVERRWYRFRLLNASNARTYQLELRGDDGSPLLGALHQIGTDSGLLPEPIELDRLILAPGERADILVDFRDLAGRSITMVNTLNPPPEPGATTPNQDVMQFRVNNVAQKDDFAIPPRLSASYVRLTHVSAPNHSHRWIILTPGPGHPAIWEMEQIEDTAATVPTDGIIQVRTEDGTLVTLRRIASDFRDRVNHIVPRNSWEQWAFLHLGGPAAHPMHIHLIRFQALGRDQYDVSGYSPRIGGTTAPVTHIGPVALDTNEMGWKDVIRVGPGQLVRVLGRFAGATGQYVYHCHILVHEDEGMMRPFIVVPPEVMAVDPHSGGGHQHAAGAPV